MNQFVSSLKTGWLPLDISGSFVWEEELPRPQWDLLHQWVENRVEPDGLFAAWTDIARQWLDKLGPALGKRYYVKESDNFFILAPRHQDFNFEVLLDFAENCRQEILTTLPDVAAFTAPGKQVIIALKDEEDYYKYLAVNFPEGHHGGSRGVFVREGYPHVALQSIDMLVSQMGLAHELTHSALAHLSPLPQWIEEGLAQLFEQVLASRPPLEVSTEMARKHKNYWTKHGLDSFWRGEGFHKPGKEQRLSYELAEILFHLLVDSHRPRWFGLDQSPQQRFFAFLREADEADCGEASCQGNLGFGLEELAARFLGAGNWAPSL